jgi:hypothetical protein
VDHFQDFSLYPELAEGIRRSSEDGHRLTALLVPKGPVVNDLSAVPDDAEFVKTRGDAQNIQRLAELENLVAVWAHWPSMAFFQACAKAPRLRALFVGTFEKLGEVPLAGATSLEHLMLHYAHHLIDLSFLRDLPALRTLELADMNRLDLNTMPELPQVIGMQLAGGMWSKFKVQSFAPLTRLPNLRYLEMVSMRTADGSLRPLAELTHLEELNMPNYGAIEEFARLSGALPNTLGSVLTPFFTPINGGVARAVGWGCKRCGRATRMMTGRPAVFLCDKCDQAKLDRRITRWEAARASGWPRAQ